MGDLSKEVDDMLGSFLSGDAETPPVETPPVETPPVETPPVETPPVEEPPVEEPPAETPPIEEPPTEEPPVEEEETAEQLRERLEKTIAFYEGRGPAPKPAEPSAEPKPAEPQPQPEPEPAKPKEIKVEPFNFVTRAAVEEAMDDPDKLVALINAVGNQARTMAIQEAIPLAQEQTMLSVPQVTAQYIKRYNAMKTLVDDFYTKNSDLKMVQRSVGMIANEVHSEHADWTVQQVFDEAATRTRTALGLKAPVQGAKPVQGTKPIDNPAFANPSQSRSRGTKKSLTGMAKEIDDLIS